MSKESRAADEVAAKAIRDMQGLMQKQQKLIDEVMASDDDGDGLTLKQEQALGTDPTDADSDDDDLADGVERRYKTSPVDKDSDDDGLLDGEERRVGTDPRNWDSDGDHLGDGSEKSRGRNPLVADEPEPSLLDRGTDILFDTTRTAAEKLAEGIGRLNDWDGDGLTNDAEKVLGTKADDADSDDDGLTDGQESTIFRGSDPLKADTDGDGLTDLEERQRGTYARNPDSDTDGVTDGAEVRRGFDPMDDDSDDDGVGDADEVLQATAGRGASAPARVAPTSPSSPRTPVAGPSSASSASSSSSSSGPKDPPSIEDFLRHALAQEGDKYKFGAEASAKDADPEKFDCSELVEWAAARAGVKVPDGTWRQYQAMHKQGGEMDVDEALATPGALLFSFSGDPLKATSRPAKAHVAISLGDGGVLEASSSAGEVLIRSAEGRVFTHAAVMPGFEDARTPPDSASSTVDEMLHRAGFGEEFLDVTMDDLLISSVTSSGTDTSSALGDEEVVTTATLTRTKAPTESTTDITTMVSEQETSTVPVVAEAEIETELIEMEPMVIVADATSVESIEAGDSGYSSSDDLFTDLEEAATPEWTVGATDSTDSTLA